MGQAHGLANLFILLAPLLGMMGLLLIMNAARNPVPTPALILYGLGFTLFLVAKLSLIRSGRLITFGSRLMRPTYRAVYRLGYALMAAGALFSFAISATLSGSRTISVVVSTRCSKVCLGGWVMSGDPCTTSLQGT